MSNLIPAQVPHPGKIIQKELDARGWDAAKLAYRMNVSEQYLSDILIGIRMITPESAIQLGIAFGTSAKVWLNLEGLYRKWKERQGDVQENS